MTLRPTRTLEGRLTAIAIVAAAATVALLVLTFNLVLARTVGHDIDNRLRARAAAALTTVGVRNGTPHLFADADDLALDNEVWVYSRGAAVERPRAGRALQRAADVVAHRGSGFADVDGSQTRLDAVPIVRRGRRYGTLVAGVSIAGYYRTTNAAMVGSAVFGVLMLIVVAAVSRGVVRSALRPVAEMTAQAARWSRDDRHQRFGVGNRPDELDRLAATFDRLLDRLAATLRHEQRLTSELSHELRTPLARILAESEMLLRRPRSLEEHRHAAEAIHRSAAQTTRLLDTLLAAARADAKLDHGRSDAEAAVLGAADAAAAQATDHGVDIRVKPPASPMSLAVDEQVVAAVVGPLLSNACRYGTSQVGVSLERDDGRVVIEVTDDGPGVAAEELDRIFEPGYRGRAAAAKDGSGAGLGLTLARRLATAAGGDVRAQPTDHGARFRVELPAA